MLEYRFCLIYNYALERENMVRENQFSGIIYALLLYDTFASTSHLKF